LLRSGKSCGTRLSRRWPGGLEARFIVEMGSARQWLYCYMARTWPNIQALKKVSFTYCKVLYGSMEMDEAGRYPLVNSYQFLRRSTRSQLYKTRYLHLRS